MGSRTWHSSSTRRVLLAYQLEGEFLVDRPHLPLRGDLSGNLWKRWRLANCHPSQLSQNPSGMIILVNVVCRGGGETLLIPRGIKELLEISS